MNPFSGSFETEICVPVRVQYHVDEDGDVEVTHVALTPLGAITGKLAWERLARTEEGRIYDEAVDESKKIKESRDEERSLVYA